MKPWAILALFILVSNASAVVNLSGAYGKAILNSLQKAPEQSPRQSDIWTWGSDPSGPVNLSAMVQDFNVLASEDRNSYKVATSEPGTFEDPWMGVSGGGSSGDGGDSGGSGTYEEIGFGTSTKGEFDCTCFKTDKTAQFPEPTEAKAW